ncbi:AAA family ATPase [Brevibacillus composti]|uniref:AAA family ATPase n=1 Tax=Brevibacillus composti TaxID=2796470 RepID=A0A7T5JPN7_9BACL|nr:AAA family ATPase [Brevibacillus composti]QQE75271.1 AAA family ATPase [Brevibacillus composti]QUO42298.1 AAA family ATPase [Brevibacillus composti]
MRIDELSIKGFGKWRDARFRFAPGLNLFAAPNEAGKTTLLQALFASLYGMKKDYARSARYLPEYERYLPWHDGSYETVVRYELDGKRYQLHRRLAKEREQAQLYLDPDWTEVTHLYQEDRRKERNFLELHLGLTRSLFTDLTWIRRTPLEAAAYLLPSLSGGGETDPAVNRMLSEMDRELAQIGKKERAENTLLGKAGARVAEKERELAEAEKSWAAVQALTRQLAVWEERRQELQHGMERIHQRLARLQAAEQNWQTRWQQSFAQRPWERAEQWIETAGTEEERELHRETWRKWTALGTAYAEEKSRLLSIREDVSRQERIEETYRRASELRKTREACIAEAQKLAESALHSGRQRRKPDARHVSPALWWTGSIFGLLLAVGLYAAGEPVLSLIALSVCLAAAGAGAMVRRRKQAGEGHSHQQRAWLEWQEKAAGCEAEIDGLLRQWGMADWDSFLVLREEEKHRAQGKEAGIAALEGRHQEEQAQLARQWGEAFRRLLEEEKTGLDREREQLEQEQRQLGEQLQLIREQMARAAGEIGGQDEVSLAKARSEYEEAVEDLRRLQMKREALALARETLQQVLNEWNREFSPAVNRIASELMARITGGKYADVRLDPQSQFDVKIWEASHRRIVEQERCSTGTQDQLYLVQRLALLRHVSGQSEPLPIFLDDHFVHYDAGRLERTLELLAELSREHQVFLFSCTERERELLQPWIEGDGRHRLHLLPSS